MPRRLEDEEISRQLGDLPGWTGDAAALVRTIDAHDFPTAVRIVSDVAEVAEEMDHHPDIDIRYRTLRFSLCTHSVGHAVTQLDVELAHRVETILREHGASTVPAGG
ncbi:MAG: 4a-hydroxytetrahydrobiopterin dehydratase [Actinomycetota bacterium]|nr:4a-hydroxytetrahydrobiopterin dehydratase [Actinomycetota bacterium]